MAKLLIIALAVGIVVCTPDPVNNPINYKEGHEYMYDYETQIMSGLPVGSKFYSGLKLVTRVRFQVVSLFNVKMELVNPRLFKINGLLDTYDPTKEMVPVQAFTELLDEDAVRMKKELVKSVSFSYDRGQVEKVTTMVSDPEWSVNIKKGCLSLLEMNFNERRSLDPHVEVKVPKPQPWYTIYRVFEPSLTGVCETMYRMRAETNPEGTPNMKLEKVRNFENCLERVYFMADMLKGRPCEFCSADSAIDTFTAQSLVRYELTGTPNNYLIVSAVCESMYAFVPFTEQRGRVMTFTNQTLTLVDTRAPLTQPIPDPVTPFEHGRPLKAVVSPRDDKLRKNPFLLDKPTRDQLVQKARKILTAIVRMNEKKVDMTSDDLIKEMWRLLREMDKEGIKTIMDEATKKTTLPKTAWKTLIDLLPTVGTFESVDVLLDWMEVNNPEPDTALITYMALSLIPEPDYLTVNRYMEHVRKHYLEPNDRNLWRTMWLGLGSFGLKFRKLNRTIVKDLENEMNILTFMMEDSNSRLARVAQERRLEELKNKLHETIQLHNTVAESIITMVQDLFKKGKKEYRVLALKVIHNLGFEHFIPLLEGLALDKNEQLTVRHEAVDALMRHVTEGLNSEKVRSILLPIYFDQTEPDELRLIAFFQVLYSGPSKPVLEMIAKSLYVEPSLNVGSFVWDALMIYSNTTTKCPCIKSLAHNTTLALRFAKRPEESFKYSTIWMNNIFDKVHGQGLTSTNSFVFSPHERLPTTIANYVQGTFFGRSFWFYGLRFRGRGLDALFESLFKNPKLAALQELVNIRFKRDVPQSEERIQDIWEKLKLEPRAPVMPEGAFEFHLFDQNLYYFDLEPFFNFDAEALSKETPEKQVKVLEQKVISALPKMLNAFEVINRFLNTDRSFFLPFIHTVMPSETGLPLYLCYNMLGSFKLNGEMTLKPTGPAGGSLLERTNLLLNFKPSGLFEIHADMMVNMKYYHSGVTTKIRTYMDTPISMSIGGDFKKTKFYVKMTDMTPEMPFVLETFSQTFVQRIPFLAANYPQPIDKKEVIITADAEMELFSYNFGKEFFGFQYTIEGQWTRPKSIYGEQFPFCGKRTMYIKFDPMASKEIDIHFQHITEIVEDRTKEEREGSWISDTISWLFPGENEEPIENPKDQPHESPASPEKMVLEPAEPFFNLAEKDLTMSYLERKFVNETTFVKSGLKCGMAITITRPGPSPDFKMQVTTLYQMDPRGLKHWYTFDLTHFTPENPKKPWRMITSAKMFLPTSIIEPSSLLDNEYQTQVQGQINKELPRDEQDFTAQFDINYYIMINSIKQLLITERRDMNSRVDIHELINHILEQSVSLELEQVETLVQDQRRIEREARELRDRPVDIAKVEAMYNELTQILKKTELILTKTDGILKEVKISKEPQEAVMIQYLVISQTRTLSELERVLNKFKIVMSKPKYSELLAKMKTIREMLYKVMVQQFNLTLKKERVERQEEGIEIEPSELKIHEKLIGIEMKLIDVLNTVVKHYLQNIKKNQPYSYEINPSDSIPELTKIAELSEGLMHDVNGHLERVTKIDKLVRVKMADVLLQMTQVIQILDDWVLQIENRATEAPEPKLMQLKKTLLDTRYRFDTQVGAFAKRILLAVNFEKEKIYLATIMTPEMERDLKILNTIYVKQLQLFETLNRPPVDKITESWLQSIVEEVEKVYNELKNFFRKYLHFSWPGLRVSPVLMKTAGELPTQMELLDTVRIFLEERLVLEAANGRKVDSMKALHKQVIVLIEDTIRSASRLTAEFKLPPRPERIPTPVPSTALSSLARQAISIDAKHLQVKSQVQKLRHELINSPNRNAVPRYGKPSAHVWRLKEQVYGIVKMIAELQEEASVLQKVLTDELAERPENGFLEELLSTIEKRLEQLTYGIQLIEEPLKKQALIEPPLLQPLQNLQQAKDSLHRYLHTVKLARHSRPSLLKSKDPHSMKQPESPRRTKPLREPWQPRDLMSAFRGEATITFGTAEEKMKTIFIKFVARKTLQQLLWERNQILPSRQDEIVRRYLSDKELPDDRTALQYREIKAELNSYRHIHFFCTYEETIPWTIKNYMFKLHQTLKYYFYNEAFISLPMTQSPLTNKFEVVMDFDRADRWMSMRVDTAYEITQVDYLRVPSWFRTMMFPATSSLEQNMIYYYAGMPTESCYVTPRRIHTFDGKRLMPEIDVTPCESVLAMDCSPNHEFVVTRVPKSAGTPKVSVLIKQHIIDIIREDPSKVIVKCDGEIMDISQNPVVIEKGGMPVHITKVMHDGVLIMIPQIGLFVASNGEKAAIQVGRSHTAKVCGLCGNMDGILPNDLMGPMKVLYPEPKSMASTYMIPSEKCDAKTIQKEMKVDEIREQSVSGQVTPLQRTAVLLTRLNGIPKTCFSITPIRICPDNTRPVKEENHLVQYYCMKRGRRARKLRNRASVGVINEMQDETPNYSATVSQPWSCINM